MCGRVYRGEATRQEITEAIRTGYKFQGALIDDYNVAPTTFQQVARVNPETGRSFELMRWGLVPHNSPSIDKLSAYSMINARGEDLFERRTWKNITHQRGLFYADGFFEWREDEKGKKGPKHPQAYQLRNGRAMSLATLYDIWLDPLTQQPLESFAIITTHANGLLEQLPHSRFPVVIRPEFRDAWLTEPTIPIDLIKPLDSDELVTWLCDPAVGKTSGKDVRHDAGLLHPQHQPETLSLF